MDTNRYFSSSFYDRTIDTIINNLSEFTGSELKLMLVIAKLTLPYKSLAEIPIKIDDLMVVCYSSKKTIIQAIKGLVEKEFLIVNRRGGVHGYSLNRSTIFKLSVVDSESENIFERVVFSQSIVEKMKFERSGFPPNLEIAINHWNKYVHVHIDIDNEIHKKCIQYGLNASYTHLELKNKIHQLVSHRANRELLTDEIMLEIFQFKRRGRK